MTTAILFAIAYVSGGVNMALLLRCGRSARKHRASMADRIEYLLDDGWPAADIAAQIQEEYA